MKMSVIKQFRALPGRFYRRGMSARGVLNNVIDYVGDQKVFYGSLAIAVIIFLLSLLLFADWFAALVFLISLPVLLVIAKVIFYEPTQVVIDLGDDNTRLEYVKEVQLGGDSELVIHSQPGYGKEKHTYVVLGLVNTIAIKDCRNITSVTDRSWKDIEIRYFHPIEGAHKLQVTAPGDTVKFKVQELKPDYCRVLFNDPVPAEVKIEVKKMSPIAR